MYKSDISFSKKINNIFSKIVRLNNKTIKRYTSMIND